LVVGLGGDEVHLPSQAKVVGQTPNPPLLRRTVRAAGPPYHHQSDIRAIQSGQACHGNVKAFERLNPAYEEQYRSLAEPSDPAGNGPWTGRKVGVVDTWRDDLNPRRLRTVVVDQLPHLLGTASKDYIGTPNHLGLCVNPTLRFQIAGLGLDSSQRMEGCSQRKVALVLETVPGYTAQPVIG
jgi:hypothetical protein